MIKRWPPRKTLTARNSPQICLCKVDSIYGIVADVVDVRTDHMTFRKISKKVVSVDSWALFFLWCPYSCGVFLWTDASHMNITEQICTNLTGKIDGGCIFVLSRRHWECLPLHGNTFGKQMPMKKPWKYVHCSSFIVTSTSLFFKLSYKLHNLVELQYTIMVVHHRYNQLLTRVCRVFFPWPTFNEPSYRDFLIFRIG